MAGCCIAGSGSHPTGPMTVSTSHTGTWWMSLGFVLLWNSGFIGAEYALPWAGPLTLLFWRYALLTVALAGYLALRGRLTWPGLPAASTAALVGVLAHGVWLGCVFLSLQAGVAAGVVALVIALQPLATGALSGPVVGEHTPPVRWAGLVLGLAGVLLAVLARHEHTEAVSMGAYLLPFGSVVAITVASLIQRWLHVRRHAHGVDLDLGLFYQSLGTLLAATLPAILTEGLATTWTPAFVAALAWVTFGVSLAAYALMWGLIRRMDATRVASLFYFGPPVTMLMAWVAFGDHLLPSDLAGLVFVAAGVMLTHHPTRTHRSRCTGANGVRQQGQMGSVNNDQQPARARYVSIFVDPYSSDCEREDPKPRIAEGIR